MTNDEREKLFRGRIEDDDDMSDDGRVKEVMIDGERESDAI